MSPNTANCDYGGCRNATMITSQCSECDKYFCDKHKEAHISEKHVEKNCWS
jgi:hypothetical protein